MTREELIVAVSAAIYDADEVRDGAIKAIALVRAETLEEAAVVFSRYEDDPFPGSTVATHLRKMKGKP